MSKFITNQNIEINLNLASLGDRILAFIIDALIILMYIIIGTFLIGVVEGDVFPVVFGGALFTPLFFYSLLFEWFGNGQTPGKRFRNIRVIRNDGTAAGPAQYLLRWLFRPIDFGLYGSVAVLSIIITKNAQRVGDLSAGTFVINSAPSATLDDYSPVAQGSEEKLDFPQVKQLSHAQIELIRKTLIRRRDGLDTNALEQMAAKVKLLLGIETQLPDVKFLYTIIKDYERL